MNSEEYSAFQVDIYDHYRERGRSLPWRTRITPYRVFVSEIMLQQTQVDRVVPKFKAFVRRFPSFTALARASRADVLSLWSGLGYNRRAKFLQEGARIVVNDHHGRLPKTVPELMMLPGIGPYTAGAIVAFAYNKPAIFIETNIRTVYIHQFFPNTKKVPDALLLPIIEGTLDKENPRQWYWALMDYGTYVKQTLGNASVRSSHYTKQKPFKGSNRQMRGAILKLLIARPLTARSLKRTLTSFDEDKIDTVLASLTHEGMIHRKGRLYKL